MATNGKGQNDVYDIEDDVKTDRFNLSFAWLKTRRGKIIAIASAVAIVGGGSALAGITGAKVAQEMPRQSGHHYFFNPNLYGNYGYYPTGPKGTKLVWGQLPARKHPRVGLSGGKNGRPSGAPSNGAQLGPPNPKNQPGGIPTAPARNHNAPPKHN